MKVRDIIELSLFESSAILAGFPMQAMILSFLYGDDVEMIAKEVKDWFGAWYKDKIYPVLREVIEQIEKDDEILKDGILDVDREKELKTGLIEKTFVEIFKDVKQKYKDINPESKEQIKEEILYAIWRWLNKEKEIHLYRPLEKQKVSFFRNLDVEKFMKSFGLPVPNIS